MKTLVLGGDGFVGQYLLGRLAGTGGTIVATTLSERPAADTLDPTTSAAIDWRSIDVLDPAGVERLFDDVGPDRVFHLAAISSSATARARPADALRVNAEGTLNVLAAAAAAGTEGPIVVAGSADAYGPPPAGEVLDEAVPLRPVTPYGVSKAAQEVVALGIGRAHELDVRVARLFPLIGPGQAAGFVLPSFCRRALRIASGEADPVLRVGNLDIERDFTDVRDGARALSGLGDVDGPADRVFNVGSGRGTSIRRLLEWVLAAAGIAPEVIVDPALARPGEPSRVVADATRLRAATGWRVERDLQAAVRDTLRWLQERGAS